MTDAIVTRQLTKCYDGQRVVNGLNLRVPRGSVYGLLGRNGAGKSTTVKLLTGMVHADFGSIELLGENICEMAPERREKIAYIAENHPLCRWMTVDGAVRFARSFYRNWNQELVAQILDHFEVPGGRRLGRMSNGQRAQVSLAIALGPDPELLILDDPTLGLDTVVRREFLESMIQIIHRSGRTILMSSHILNDVDRVGNVTRARVTQIMNLLNLAPEIQEEILCLPVVEIGRDTIHLRELQAPASAMVWTEQRRQWRTVTRA